MLARNASVPIVMAAERAGVDVAQIHRWAAIEGLEIRRRGHLETVILEDVLALSVAARRRTAKSKSALIARLADARVQNPSVSGLQQTARDRNTGDLP